MREPIFNRIYFGVVFQHNAQPETTRKAYATQLYLSLSVNCFVSSSNLSSNKEKKKKTTLYLKDNAKLESPLSTRCLNTTYKMLSRMTVPEAHMWNLSGRQCQYWRLHATDESSKAAKDCYWQVPLTSCCTENFYHFP